MERRTFLKAGLAVPAAAVAAATLPAPAEASPGCPVRSLGAHLSRGIDFLPDGSAWSPSATATGPAVPPRRGRCRVGRLPDAFNDGGEGGLMGVAVSPRFAQDRWVYFFLTTTSDNRIVRVRFVGGALSGAPQPILTGIPSGSTHNGGGLWFTRHPEPVRHHRGHPQQRSRPEPEQPRGQGAADAPEARPAPGTLSATASTPTATATPRASPSATTAGSGRPSSARTPGTSSTASCPDATTAGRGRRLGRGRWLRDPLGPVAPRRRLAERRDDVEGPRLGRCPARPEPLVGRLSGRGVRTKHRYFQGSSAGFAT